MLGKGSMKMGRGSTIYLNANLTSQAQSGFSGSTKWFVDILEDNGNSYKVKVTHNSNGASGDSVFEPTTFWVLKSDVDIISWNGGSTGGGTVQGLETGDTMILSDKNGKRLGVWTYKKD